jgi:UDP-N-acetylglucosamine pyrophosphorylase
LSFFHKNQQKNHLAPVVPDVEVAAVELEGPLAQLHLAGQFGRRVGAERPEAVIPLPEGNKIIFCCENSLKKG